MKHYDHNRRKLAELRPEVHSAAYAWLDACRDAGLDLRITEAYRSQARQDQLFAMGRTAPGPIRTWTRNSVHTKRLAVDLYPDPMLKGPAMHAFYARVDEIGRRFGVVRPPELLKLGDYGHYDFSTARLPDGTKVTPEARKKGLLRRLARTRLPELKLLIPRLLDRL